MTATTTHTAPATAPAVDPNIAWLVDTIGGIKARIAPELARLKEMEAQLKAHGNGRYKGAHYEAKVFAQERNTLDMAAVREKLSPQFITAHTTTTEVTILKVTARQLGDNSLVPVSS
jgi:hypothetical protein